MSGFTKCGSRTDRPVSEEAEVVKHVDNRHILDTCSAAWVTEWLNDVCRWGTTIGGVLGGTPDLAQLEEMMQVGILTKVVEEVGPFELEISSRRKWLRSLSCFKGERHRGKHGTTSKVSHSRLDFVADIDNHVPETKKRFSQRLKSEKWQVGPHGIKA